MPRFLLPLCLLMSSLSLALANPASPRELTPHAGAVFAEAMTWADQAWNPSVGLLRSTQSSQAELGGIRHGVRDTAMYATALLFRDGPGDRERAAQAIEGVLARQLQDPGAVYHGTFSRFAEEARPRAGAVIWEDYDPNWRQFIGCCWVIILRRDADKVGPVLCERLLASLQLAIDGEIGEKRLKPSYSNIALMHAFVALNTGHFSGRQDLIKLGEYYTREVRAEYFRTHSFSEFNSPTYYGVDLFALGLWRSLGPDAMMRQAGAEIEAGLWDDIADFYHAGLRNLCGPFDRTYGMDMTHYLSLTGLLLRLELGPEPAPLPPLTEHMEHGNDLGAGFLYPQVPSIIGEDARHIFRHHAGPRLVSRSLSEGRSAQAWLGDQVMMGAEGGGGLKDVNGPSSQYRPATIHWRLPTGKIAWLALTKAEQVDASLKPGELSVRVKQGAVFSVHVPAADASAITATHWSLPGLKLKVQANGKEFVKTVVKGGFDCAFPDSTELRLVIE